MRNAKQPVRIRSSNPIGVDSTYLTYYYLVGKEKAENIHVKLGTSEETFVGLRTTRDEKLTAPNLILPSIQV
jgi:hypothetical protein